MLEQSLRRLGKIVQRLRRRNADVTPQQVYIQDFSEFITGATKKRALLSYLIWPLLPPPSKRDRICFSNLGIAQEIPRGLNELGYVVDIINYDDVDWQPTRHYDLFIGHAGINFERISRRMVEDATQIYFSTGSYWKYSNVQEAQRVLDLALRKGYLLSPDKSIHHSEDYANQKANGIICLGNRAVLETYQAFEHVIGMNNATYPVLADDVRQKDHREGRGHFLYFCGGGSIHNGLDVLLEAFASTDLHLHICQKISTHFAEVYQSELNLPNIHFHDFVPMRSPQFKALAAQCNWTISATCAEGQPGGTIECMGHGLIPILPRSANIDLGAFGLLLPDCRVETIQRVIEEAAAMPVVVCQERSQQVREVVAQEYSPEKFRSNFMQAVSQIVQATARG